MHGQAPVDVPSWVDRAGFGRFQLRVVLLGILITTFDGFDTQAIAFTGPAIAQAFGVGPGGLTPVITAGVAGMALGALLFGPIGDRYGRRVAALAATAVFGLFALLTAFATSIPQLVVLRFLTGIGMGGAAPNVFTLGAEYSPQRHRGIVMLVAGLGLPLGAILGGLIATRLIPHFGWQGVFVLGGVAPLLALPWLWRALPESPHYLTRRGAHGAVGALLSRINPRLAPPPGSVFGLPESGARVGVAELLRPGLRRSTLAIWVVYFFNWVAWFSLVLWLPSALHAAGLPAERAPLATVTLNGAALIFVLPLAWYIPRLPARTVIATLAVLGIAVSLGLAAADTRWGLVFLLVGLAGLGIGGPQIALNYLAVTLYPTAARATGLGWAIGLGRIGTVAGGALGGPVLERFGTAGFFASLAVPMALALCGTLLVRPPRPTEGAIPEPVRG
jgi:MFS transporter, AAHS family, 4-hydroxybenzoate transporter